MIASTGGECHLTCAMFSTRSHILRNTQHQKKYTQSPPNRRIATLRRPPGRRRLIKIQNLNTFFLSIVLLFSLCTPALTFDRPRFAIRRPTEEAWENEIVFDSSPSPVAELVKRQKNSKSESTASEIQAPTSTSDDTPSSTETGDSSESGGIIAAPTPTSTDLPKAFDGGLGTNYTQTGCLNFLRDMTRNDTFNACLPVSLLLQNSQSFFRASRSKSSLSPVLTASCNIVQPSCSAIMASFALDLRSSSACSSDYDKQQPTVRQAYNGLVSYDLLYRSICTKSTPSAANNNSADFCYTNAVTNLSSPTDSYIYFLPLGITLPASSQPTCSQCLKQTMELYGPAARNKSQPVSLTYANAAQQVNLNCGPDFVNQSIPGVSGSGAGAVTGPRLGVVVMGVAIVFASQTLGLV